MPRSSQSAGSTTCGASLVQFADAVAVASAMRCSSSVMVGCSCWLSPSVVLSAPSGAAELESPWLWLGLLVMVPSVFTSKKQPAHTKINTAMQKIKVIRACTRRFCLRETARRRCILLLLAAGAGRRLGPCAGRFCCGIVQTSRLWCQNRMFRALLPTAGGRGPNGIHFPYSSATNFSSAAKLRRTFSVSMQYAMRK